MRIALIGNMNNNFFSLCRYLRDNGYDASLILLNEYDHFLPECDAFDDSYKEYTIQPGWPKRYFFDPQLKKELQSTLEPFDYFIGCDYAPAYLNLLGKKLNLYIPYGSDLVYFSFPAKLPLKIRLYRFLTGKRPVDPAARIGKYEFDGINGVDYIVTENAYFVDEILNEHFPNVKRVNITIPMVYNIFKNSTVQEHQLSGNEHVVEFLQKTKGKKIFFSHMRHRWVVGTTEYLKGNDKIIHAFAEYCKLYKDTILVLFNYGPDAEASHKLIDELGLTEYVLWMPVMDRKYIMYMLKHADLCIGEIKDSFITYGVALEAIVMQTPLAHNYKEGAKVSGYDTLYDAFNVTNTEEIKQVMIRVHNNDFDKEAMVSASYKWYQTAIVDKFLETFKSIMSVR